LEEDEKKEEGKEKRGREKGRCGRTGGKGCKSGSWKKKPQAFKTDEPKKGKVVKWIMINTQKKTS